MSRISYATMLHGQPAEVMAELDSAEDVDVLALSMALVNAMRQIELLQLQVEKLQAARAADQGRQP